MGPLFLFFAVTVAIMIAMLVLHQVRRFIVCTGVDDAQEAVMSPHILYVPLFAGLLPVLVLAAVAVYPRVWPSGGGARVLSRAVPYSAFLALVAQLVGAGAVLRIKDAHDEIDLSATWGYLFLLAAAGTAGIMTYSF